MLHDFDLPTNLKDWNIMKKKSVINFYKGYHSLLYNNIHKNNLILEIIKWSCMIDCIVVSWKKIININLILC